MSSDINVVALVRGSEQYIFMFDEANRTETLRTLGRYAADPDLSFTWYDAAILSQKVREVLPANSLANHHQPSQPHGHGQGSSSHSGSPTVPKPPARRFNLPAREDSRE